jgi:putative PIG3 family NAD(P)H quinone oxidoreductase
MIAIEIREPGGPEVLTAVDRPIPNVGASDVLIKVAAAGVNRPDVMQRQGRYPPPPGASDIPGLEVAGVIERVGESAGSWRVGESVCALVSGGGYAEYCAAPAGQCLRMPQGLTPIQAAALPETTFTVWTNLFDRGRLKKGEAVLVHGGASGIGTTAIQLAHAFGATVFATAGTDEKCAACEAIGADRAFNYRQTDFVAATREATGGRGVDVVLDIVGGDYLQRNLDVLAVDGRLILVGQLGGHKAQISTTPIFLKRLTVTASVLRARSVAEKTSIANAVQEHVWPLLDAGTVRIAVHSTFPLRAAADAHRTMEESRHFGKLVLIA